MEYKLLAADMDATALNSKKELTPGTVSAMERAIVAGKQVVFSTGRSLSLVRPYMEQVRGMRYAITSSGASVTDILTGEHIFSGLLEPETVKYIISAAAGLYVMPMIYRDDESYGTRSCIDSIKDFRMEAYEPIYRSSMHLVDDVFAFYMQDPTPIEKINLFFADTADTESVYSLIRELPVSFTCVTDHAIEINAPGVNKALGLKKLCERLGISMAECIAVGDADNDTEMIKCAGLGAAMGNANAKIMSLADTVTADCEHDGAAQVIEEYLLAKN